MALTSFEQLLVWQRAHSLVLSIYAITGRFPEDEKYGLISQIRRAAVSVPANIAEGFKRRHVKDKSRFYNIAQASLDELHYFLILSVDLGYLVDNEIQIVEIENIGRMLHALQRSLTKKP